MKEVFESHPGTEEIYVVDDMPFIKMRDAINYAGDPGKIQVVKLADLDAEAINLEEVTGTEEIKPEEVTGTEEIKPEEVTGTKVTDDEADTKAAKQVKKVK